MVDQLPGSMGEATIVFLLQPGKDPTSPVLYHPISLLVDIKLLANRLSRVITEVVHEDPSGFVSN